MIPKPTCICTKIVRVGWSQGAKSPCQLFSASTSCALEFGLINLCKQDLSQSIWPLWCHYQSVLTEVRILTSSAAAPYIHNHKWLQKLYKWSHLIKEISYINQTNYRWRLHCRPDKSLPNPVKKVFQHSVCKLGICLLLAASREV